MGACSLDLAHPPTRKTHRRRHPAQRRMACGHAGRPPCTPDRDVTSDHNTPARSRRPHTGTRGLCAGQSHSATHSGPSHAAPHPHQQPHTAHTQALCEQGGQRRRARHTCTTRSLKHGSQQPAASTAHCLETRPTHRHPQVPHAQAPSHAHYTNDTPPRHAQPAAPHQGVCVPASATVWHTTANLVTLRDTLLRAAHPTPTTTATQPRIQYMQVQRERWARGCKQSRGTTTRRSHARPKATPTRTTARTAAKQRKCTTLMRHPQAPAALPTALSVQNGCVVHGHTVWERLARHTT
jgi:hypothetical protein